MALGGEDEEVHGGGSSMGYESGPVDNTSTRVVGEPAALVGEPDGFQLSYAQGKAVQEVLNRHRNGLVADAEERVRMFPDDPDMWLDQEKDISYIAGLIELFGPSGVAESWPPKR